MKLINLNDILNFIDQNTLNIITNNDYTLIDRAELQAIEEMAGYINVRYDAQKIFSNNSSITPAVKMFLIDIILYHLHSRVSPDHIPDLRVERYKSAINWLEKVADGFINPNLPVKDIDNKTPLRFGSGDKQSHYY